VAASLNSKHRKGNKKEEQEAQTVTQQKGPSDLGSKIWDILMLHSPLWEFSGGAVLTSSLRN
jgi:hypothetical protein